MVDAAQESGQGLREDVARVSETLRLEIQKHLPPKRDYAGSWKAQRPKSFKATPRCLTASDNTSAINLRCGGIGLLPGILRVLYDLHECELSFRTFHAAKDLTCASSGQQCHRSHRQTVK